MKDNSRERIFFAVGILFFAFVAVFNVWTISRYWSTDGLLASASVRIVWAFDLGMATIGAAVIFWRSSLIVMTSYMEWKNVFLFLFSVALGSLVLEFSLRFWLKHYASEDIFATYATYNMIGNKNLRYSRHPYLGYYPTPNYKNSDGDMHNSLGFRGEEIQVPKPKEIYRIVAIGGSTTYGDKLPTYKDAYPYQLEEELRALGFKNVEVINAGVGDYDSWPTLINLEFRVLNLQPDMVIFYEGTNELETRLVYPSSAYQPDNTGRVRPMPIPNIGFFNRLVIYRMIFGRFGIIPHYGALSQLYDAQTYVGGVYYSQLKNKSYPLGVFKDKDAFEILGENLGIYSERNIQNIISVSKGAGATPILFSFAYSPLTAKTSSPLYKEGIVQYNQMVRVLSNKNQIPFFDFSAKMPTDASMWTRDGIHVNVAGAKLQAKLFANFLINYITKSASLHVKTINSF